MNALSKFQLRRQPAAAALAVLCAGSFGLCLEAGAQPEISNQAAASASASAAGPAVPKSVSVSQSQLDAATDDGVNYL